MLLVRPYYRSNEYQCSRSVDVSIQINPCALKRYAHPEPSDFGKRAPSKFFAPALSCKDRSEVASSCSNAINVQFLPTGAKPLDPAVREADCKSVCRRRLACADPRRVQSTPSFARQVRRGCRSPSSLTALAIAVVEKCPAMWRRAKNCQRSHGRSMIGAKCPPSAMKRSACSLALLAKRWSKKSAEKRARRGQPRSSSDLISIGRSAHRLTHAEGAHAHVIRSSHDAPRPIMRRGNATGATRLHTASRPNPGKGLIGQQSAGPPYAGMTAQEYTKKVATIA